MTQKTQAEQDRFCLFSFDSTLCERTRSLRGSKRFFLDLVLDAVLGQSVLFSSSWAEGDLPSLEKASDSRA